MSFTTYSRSSGTPSSSAGTRSYLSASLPNVLLSLSKQESRALLTLLQNEACTSSDAIDLIEGFVYSLQYQKQTTRPSPLTYSAKPSPPSSPPLFQSTSPSASPSFSPSSSQSASPTPQISVFKDQSIHEASPQLLRERARSMQKEARELTDLASLLDDAMLIREYTAQALLLRQESRSLNALASEMLFEMNNMHRKPNQVDLHGLYVAEAIDFTARCVAEAQARGDDEITFIVGRGLHSSDGRAKLAPAVEGKLRKLKLEPAQHPKNAGLLVVRLRD
ncbi:hypothetical protein DENSPDRAFT_209616 [Dentipellis sp. KUC8613]|nr:hypothetical protein DENSPDRAFT_209616 [Dentipellis sp. KUC8613]